MAHAADVAGRTASSDASTEGPSLESIEPFFQPIVDLRHGRVSGFEALARLRRGGATMPTAAFLTRMPSNERLGLFSVMLDRSLAALTTILPASSDLYVSINVERFLFVADSFFEILETALAAHAYPGSRLVLEILEGEQIEDEAAMIRSLERVRGLGVRVALDDIGTAHASLFNIKTLPVDILKLDQSFARGLTRNPHDLQFILSMLSLARGLGKSLVVEGVETAAILDAMMILGIEYTQGYAIARPMEAGHLPAWLAAFEVPVATRAPCSLLGAFASHLTVVETCRILVNQPLPILWKEESKNPDACEIGRYFNRCGLHDTPFGLAHKQFHRVMTCYGTDYPLWKSGADGFGDSLASAIVEEQDR